MRQLVVCDSSALVAVLLNDEEAATWVVQHLHGSAVAGPALLPFEVGNVVRRQEAAGLASADQAAQAHADLVDVPLQLWPYSVLADRVWQLRGAMTSYDASYVAVAEALDAPLVTLDRRLARAPGARCEVLVPPTL